MLRVRTVFTGVAGTPYYSNLYFAGPSGADVAVEAVGAFWDVYGLSMVNELSWTVEGAVAVMDVATGEITGYENVDPVTGDGSSTGEMLPRASQALIHLHTGVYRGGREVRGRIFIPALDIAVDDDGQVASTIVTGTPGVVEDLINDSPGWGVWSRKNGRLEDVLSGAMWAEFAMLRSRRD